MAELQDPSYAARDAMRALPVAPYLGLTEAAARAHAATEGRFVRVLSSLTGPRRLDLIYNRVNVELDTAGLVLGADAG